MNDLKLFLPNFNLFGVITSYPKLSSLEASPLAMGKLSIVLDILTNNVSHWRQVIGTAVSTPNFSMVSLSARILLSTLPLSEGRDGIGREGWNEKRGMG